MHVYGYNLAINLFIYVYMYFNHSLLFLIDTHLAPFKPYMVTLYAATNVGESNPASILVYTEHGGNKYI